MCLRWRLAATAFTVAGGHRATTVIEERHDPAVVIEKDRPAATVTVKERGMLGDKKTIKKETTGVGRLHVEDRAQGRSRRLEDRQQDQLRLSVLPLIR